MQARHGVGAAGAPRARSRTISPRPLILKLGVLERQEVEIALSTIRERLLDVHTSQALELIQHARDQVSTPTALGIYSRLHQVQGPEAAVLRTRVLARLGQKAALRSGSSGGQADAQAAEEWESPWGWLLRIRRRLRGRRNLELRRWVEVHAGRTEAKLLRVHVNGLLRLIELLGAEGSYAGTAQLYTECMGVPRSLSRAIYFLALDQLGEAAGVSSPAAPSPPPEPAGQKEEEQLLRIVKR